MAHADDHRPDQEPTALFAYRHQTLAAFSNEAGLGSAPIAHPAVKTKHPASEGLVALPEPFIDTVVICTMTALTIVIANPASWAEARAGQEIAGVTITSDAFETVLPWFPGLKAWTHLFGRSKVSELTYKVVYTLFAITGSLLTLQTLIDMADAVLFMSRLGEHGPVRHAGAGRCGQAPRRP